MIQNHLHVKHSFTLSPHRIMLCFLLHEARSAPLVQGQQQDDENHLLHFRLTDQQVHQLAQFCSHHIEERGAPELTLQDLYRVLEPLQNFHFLLKKVLYMLLPVHARKQLNQLM